MIKEDYIGFETAKLLKEKGFDIQGYASIKVFGGNTYEVNGEWITPKEDTIIPTLQMAMKWLREVHNLFIQVTIVPHTTVTMEQKYYVFAVCKDRRNLAFRSDHPHDSYSTYEEACEAGIRYCLESLV